MAMKELAIRVEERDNRLSFVFDGEALNFVTFVVADSQERVLWDLCPASMDSDDSKGYFGTVAADGMLGKKIVELMPKPADDIMARYPKVDRIDYGRVPNGYKELVSAAPLEPGVVFNAVVMRVMESGAVRFSVNDRIVPSEA